MVQPPLEERTRRERICVIRRGSLSRDAVLRREVEALADEGMEITVICARAPREDLPISSDATPGGAHRVFVAGPMAVGRRRAFWSTLLAEKWFTSRVGARLLVEHVRTPFDFIQVDTPPDFLVFAALIPRLLGARVVLRVAEPEPEYWQERMSAWYQRPAIALLGLARRLSLHAAHHVVVSNRTMRNALGAHGADINRISVVLDATDADAVKPDDYRTVIEEVALLRREERRKGVFRIVTRAPEHPASDVTTVIEAVALLRERLPNAECVVLGAGDSAADILDAARRRGVAERVQCPQGLDSAAVVRLILAADACVVARRRTPYASLLAPLELYNYVALGKAVVAPRLDAVTSYFPEDSLVYYEAGDAVDLGDKIYAVFAHPEETPARVAAASDIYDAHRWERERRKYLAVFKNLSRR